jgi:hypothetical protein
MMRIIFTVLTSYLAAAFGLAILAENPAPAAQSKALWEIGKPDKQNAEFALAPDGYGRFKNDGFFVVGESDVRRDWPYVHPGPDDAWAGARQHTFTILFGLKRTPGDGNCSLDIDLLDTQSKSPPKLRIEVNGRLSEHAMPAGAGDESVRGQSGKGKPHRFSVRFPASLLKSGDNTIRITSHSGSWMLYDWVGLNTPTGAELSAVAARTLLEDVRPVRALQEKDGSMFQPVLVDLRHYGQEEQAAVSMRDGPTRTVQLKSGMQTVELLVQAVASQTQRTVALEIGGKVAATLPVQLKPVRKLTVYILPHSHTDIGYTEIQTAIEKKQVNNLLQGIEHARRTAGYPEGARFVWNVEVLWAADLYLHRLGDQQRAEFLDAVKKGQVALNGMYLNELTGLCRPEELIRLFRFATKLAEQTGTVIDSAMISDVPGYTWGTVPAMAHAGIKYFSVAPNYFDRIGTILRDWENKPFYWVGPDGKTKVLVWIPFWGYAMSHRYGKLSPQLVNDFYDGLEKQSYPYDIAYVRWSGHGDNAVPDPAICDFVKDWNAKYAWPHFIISGTSEAFRAFEQHYGDKLPLVRGDWTPYWEDGAGSSALETAMNRQSSDRLVQAETLCAMLKSKAYPAGAFEDAWRNVLLYSEHTWGADCSISAPESQKTREQWEIKRGYARQADKQSRDLLAKALESAPNLSGSVDIVNTLSWPRSELAVVSAELSSAGNHVTDDAGKPVPSQRLRSGELVFLAKEVPPFAARRFTISAGTPHIGAKAVVEGAMIENGVVRVRVDEKTGGIIELTAAGIGGNFVNTAGGESLNDYLYLRGDDLKDMRRSGPATIRAGESGPLVASLLIESDAPGCKKLLREVRIVAGLDHVELINLVDKARLETTSYHANNGKESVNFAFPFDVVDGQMLLDLPLGTMRPELDQMPSACKNWFTAGRWADVSNNQRGITWVTLDAPLIQIGGITATLLNSQANPDVWRKSVAPTQKLYSWAMNNHWGTNYRAYQEGPTVFRFVLRPHRQADPAECSRFAIGFSQPLLAMRAHGATAVTRSLVHVEPADVLVTALKPADDGAAWIMRLFNATSDARSVTLKWPDRQPSGVFLSDTSEKRGAKAGDLITIPRQGLVSLRVEFK